MAKSVQINVKFPDAIVEEIDQIISKGRYRSRGELIVVAVRDYLDTIHARENGQVFNARYDSGPRT
jgi:metal-responsive CopG/Arc/MetJ family transcriptional regulator